MHHLRRLTSALLGLAAAIAVAACTLAGADTATSPTPRADVAAASICPLNMTWDGPSCLV